MSDSKTTEKKQVAKKTTTKAVAKPSTTTVKKTTTTTKAKEAKPVAAKAPAKAPAKVKSVKKIGAEQRYKMVEMAAYYIAERHGFEGNPSDFWIQAEAQIEAMLAK